MRKKVLIVCSAGNSRSVTMGWLLKEEPYRYDVVCAGVDYNSHETLKMLVQWADTIICMEERMCANLPMVESNKVLVCEVGYDRYWKPYHPELVEKCKSFAEEQFLKK